MKRLIAVGALAIFLVMGWVFFQGTDFPRIADASQWTDTDPPLNETHIFQGEINKRGRPVGFHSRPEGKNPSNARVKKIHRGPNKIGVYEAEVEIRKSFLSKWLSKRSSFFPDSMKRQTVIDAILHAYRNRTTGEAIKFRGPSGHGFTIEGYLLNNGSINTAYPIYK